MNKNFLSNFCFSFCFCKEKKDLECVINNKRKKQYHELKTTLPHLKGNLDNVNNIETNISFEKLKFPTRKLCLYQNYEEFKAIIIKLTLKNIEKKEESNNCSSLGIEENIKNLTYKMNKKGYKFNNLEDITPKNIKKYIGYRMREFNKILDIFPKSGFFTIEVLIFFF